MAADAQTLLTAANCYNCYSAAGPVTQGLLELGLLQNWLTQNHMATDAPTLLASAQCYDCYGSNLQAQGLMKLALLAQISLAKNAANDVTPQGLLAAAKCYECYGSSPYMLQLMELALLAQIAP